MFRAFSCPQAAEDLVFDDGSLGGRFQAIEGGFVDQEPLWPGQTSVMFSYVVDCTAGECNLDRQITHPINNINALIADTGVSVESASLGFRRQAAERGPELYELRRTRPPRRRLVGPADPPGWRPAGPGCGP